MATATVDLLRTLFRYEVDGDRPVGRGGCGHIWRAQDMLTGHAVALKTISEILLWDRPDVAVRHFKKEAIVAARLGEQSPYIVKVIDIGAIDGTLFYVMKWIDPQSGFSSIDMAERAGCITLAQAKAILMQVCDAVSTAHTAGIIHSDLAPQNIIFDPSTHNYMLADFGLLKIVEEVLVSKGSGSLLKGGRQNFFPPEVHSSIAALPKASDVYALAVTFRVMLEGFMCLNANIVKTPGVIRIRHEQRDAPDERDNC